MVRIRTIDQAMEEIKKVDPDTCISKRYIRLLVNTGQVPSHKVGSKSLINMDILEDFLEHPEQNRE